ncbi:MAG: hypothetical protein OEQ53_20255, partial [Saprospiraceae bacterium]|nr:hypothetical protein [Saprospiraceae bacterium]
MKAQLLFSLCFSIFSVSLISQNNGFHFQAQARDLDGEVMQNQSINIEVKIYEEDVLIYKEKHQRETTNYGFFNFIVGEGLATEGSFSTINWSALHHEVEIDMNDETLDRVPLQAVPYAKHANTADHVVNFSIDMIEDMEVGDAENGDLLGYNGSDWVPVKDNVNDDDADPNNEIQKLQLFGNQLQLSKNGGTINLPSAELTFPYSYKGLHDDQLLAIVNEGWNGIYGAADNGWGVRGHSQNNFGVAGSGLQGGVYGYSSDGKALSAFSNNGFGVHADGGNGTGVYGKG